MEEEVWAEILGFPNYLVSNFGNVLNQQRNRPVVTSVNNHGQVKISINDADGIRRTILIAPLVAEAFVKPPDRRCTNVMVLDGNLSNINYWNLAWRPIGFVWKYYHQLRTPQRVAYQNLPVVDITQGVEYQSIIDAGKDQGLLFDDIWRSTYSGDAIYPYYSVFRVISANRV